LPPFVRIIPCVLIRPVVSPSRLYDQSLLVTPVSMINRYLLLS
jgi:hypothetical protein